MGTILTDMENLFARTLLGDYEGDDAWEAVSALRRDGSRDIFDYAAEWLRSGASLKKARASDD
jgi:hypothetical protein